MEKESLQHTDTVVIKTAMSPEELAEYMGGSIEWAQNAATSKHVVFMRRVDFDADYARRYKDLEERLDALSDHIRTGRISREAEADVCFCIAWTMDQMNLMQLEQKKLVAWLMEANTEVERLQRKRGAAIKLARDPKQAAKVNVFKMWQDWQEGRTIYKSAAAFARHIVNTQPIESTKTVERWTKQWQKQARR